MPARILLVGDSGTGKTGAVLSLLEAGYQVNLADFDLGTDFLRVELAERPELRQKLSVKTFTDTVNRIGPDSATLTMPCAVARLGLALDKWDDHGPISKWPKTSVFVLDSVTFMARAFARQHMALNKIQLLKPLEARQFGPIQGQILNFMDRLHSDKLQCHYILITHLDYREFREDTYSPVGMMEKAAPGRAEPDKVSAGDIDIRAVPTVFGAKLGPQFGRSFNFMIQAKLQRIGTQPKRILQLQPDDLIDLKCPIKSLGKSLPLESGLAKILKTWESLNLDD